MLLSVWLLCCQELLDPVKGIGKKLAEEGDEALDNRLDF